ncbi:MAG: hypothetical protein ACTIJ6_04835 [Leucobacter sp.]
MSPSLSITHRAEATASVLPRWTTLLRAGVLLVVGLVIAFSATLHENFAFDVALTSSGLALIGAVYIIECSQRRGKQGAPIALLLGIVSFAAAATVFTVRIEFAFAIVIAAWALVCALFEFLGMTVAPGSRQDAAIIGAAGMLLAVLVLVFRDDAVAVIGFFGAYAVIAGVFLGIAGFDVRRGDEAADIADLADTVVSGANVTGADAAAQISQADTQVESER